MPNERKNGSNILRRISPAHKPPPSDPLELARGFAEDVRDVSRDERRRIRRELPEYDGSDEIPTVRLEMISRHESEPPAKKQVRAGLVAVGSGIGIALLTGVAALLQHCAH
jgi:hypothetical protein